MKLFPVSIVALALTFCLSSVSASPSQFKHQAKNVNCEACHKTNAPVAAAKSKSCMQCHNYQDLAVKSSKLNPNPHESHAGQLRCTLCHKEHSASQVYCKECHKNNDPKFDFKTP